MKRTTDKSGSKTPRTTKATKPAGTKEAAPSTKVAPATARSSTPTANKNVPAPKETQPAKATPAPTSAAPIHSNPPRVMSKRDVARAFDEVAMMLEVIGD